MQYSKVAELTDRVAIRVPIPQRSTVCGFEVSLIATDDLVQRVLSDLDAGIGSWIVTLNLDLLSRSLKDEAYGYTLSKADVILADGMPIVWACRRKDPSLGAIDRTTGADLTRKLLPLVPASKVAIVGGKDPRLALTRLGLKTSEYYIDDGIISLDENFVRELADELRGRRLVLVALGAPKQERLIEKLREYLPQTIFIGVGGSFEFIAGITRRAPVWMQRTGLEWTYRLACEPKRLWRRYFVECPRGAWALLRDSYPGRST